MNRRYREFDTLGVPLKAIKPGKGGNNRPGTAFWLVLIIIGSVTVWQKFIGPTRPVTGVTGHESAPQRSSLNPPAPTSEPLPESAVDVMALSPGR